MPAILPTIIAGPAIVIHNGQSFYSKGNIEVEHTRNTFQIETDMHGPIDERLDHDQVVLSFEPVGQIENIAKYFPYGVANIGTSIFAGGDLSVVIHTKDGQTITYPKGAVTQFPELRLGVKQTLFGNIQITCLGKSATQRTAADYWKTIASAAFSDTTFDETKILTQPFAAAYGDAPYDSMGSKEGFLVNIQPQIEPIMVDEIGIGDLRLVGLTATASFRPSNLTEAQIDTLLKHSGTGALEPGQSLAKADTDLVIASAGFSATIHSAGPKDMRFLYGQTEHRHGVLGFMAKRTWTSGAADALFTLAVL